MTTNYSNFNQLAPISGSIEISIFKYETDDQIIYYKLTGDDQFIFSHKKEQYLEKPHTISEDKIPTICTKTEIAGRLHRSVSTIDNWRRHGLIRTIKMGEGTRTGVLFNLEDVMEDLKKNGYTVSIT